jgi:hypothetical protein
LLSSESNSKNYGSSAFFNKFAVLNPDFDFWFIHKMNVYPLNTGGALNIS